jgi:hypothetical protein
VALRKAAVPAPATPARHALTGATALVDFTEGSSWKTWKFGNAQWQIEAWRLYDIVGELHTLAGRIGDSLSQARLYVTEVGEDGEESGETESVEIRRLAAIPLGTGSQRDDNLRLAGVDLAVGAECYIVGEDVVRRTTEKPGNWFVVTGAGVKREGGVVKVRRPQVRGGGGWLELTSGRDVLIRCWRPHPNDPDQADSFTRASIPVLREIELLTKREFAELDSRLTGAGMMPIPEGVDFPRDPEKDPGGVAGFMAYAQRAAAASMQDQSTAAAMVPIMFTVPDHLLEAMKGLEPIRFWSDLNDKIPEMKRDAIGRFATFSELPREVLEGLGNSNHWSAWLITEEGTRWIRGYLGPVADALTRGFLHLALRQMGVADVERYAFAFDVSGLAARPNRIDEAGQLHDRHLLSDEEMVQAAAFNVEQMPKPDELERRRVWEVVKLQPDLIRDPAVQKLLGLPQIEGVTETPSEPIEAVSVDARPVNDTIPEQEPDLGAALTAAIEARRVASALPGPQQVFNAAAKLIVLRALELAGGRLTTIHERRGRLAAVPRHELHHHIGPISPARAAEVTEGAFSHVAIAAADLGVPPQQLETLLSGYVHELLTRGIRHSDDLLFHGLSIANRGAGMVAA